MARMAPDMPRSAAENHRRPAMKEVLQNIRDG
jgi:hypothetical protein